MPFPFLWTGALVAVAFLSTIFAIFGLLAHLLDRTATELRGSILPGLISGLGDWTGEHPVIRRLVSPRGSEPGGEIDDTDPGPPPAIERLHPHLR